MSETFFPINDLLRRKIQTGLAVLGLSLSVASTLFLVLFAQRIGFGVSTVAKDKLTSGFYLMFFPFITLLTVLILATGVVLISFTAFVMMAQRTKDIGLMKAAGCPNDVLVGYFFAELVFVSLVSCLLGTALGVILDATSSRVLMSFGLLTSYSLDLWIPFIVFMAFFVLSLVLGAAPILSATRMEAAKAYSPGRYFGLVKESSLRVISKPGLTWRLAVRALVRHKSATIRVVLCLSAVFLLVTVAVAGALIAEGTTQSWIEDAVGRNTVLIAHRDVVSQYGQLLSRFYQGGNNAEFNFTNDKYTIPPDLVDRLHLLNASLNIDERLILQAPVKEIEGTILGDSSGETQSVGDSRQGVSLVVGIDPSNVVNKWSVNGMLLEPNEVSEAVVGDSVAQKLFSMPLNQSVAILGQNFKVVGVCFDPLNNGNVTYVPMSKLLNITGVLGPNVLMIKLDHAYSQHDILSEINATVRETNANFEVFELNPVLDKSLSFVGSVWSTIMFLPLFSLVAGSLSLVGYVMLMLNDQRQEFGILRAVGAGPRTILALVSAQNLIVLLASYAVGVAFGTIATLLILVENPVVTPYTIIEVSSWLLFTFVVTFVSSIYPAIRFARKPLLETIAQP